MKLVRRQILGLAAGAVTLAAAPHKARAESFPVRPVHIVSGFAPGGVGSIAVRLIGQALEQRWGRPVVVDHRPGAAGNLAIETVVTAPPDGYTLMSFGAPACINATLYKNLPFDFIRDIAMVASTMSNPLAMVTSPSFEAKSVADFIAYAKANPGKINMASAGNGSTSHLTGELFKARTGISMLHVPYRGDGPALLDLMAGQTQVMFDNLITAIGPIRDGRFRALAVTSAAPWPALPNIPPVADTVPGFEVSNWIGIGAPRATPAAIVATLNKAINACLAEPALGARIAELGAEPMVMSQGEFEAFVTAETQKWASAVKFSGAKVD